ncbi:MAG: cysteine--tRNA ligase [Mesorhizobium sp.]|nr:cysteine--tRNA ligase [Mesorhizobium sp.]MBL8577074.1 cysteine--tRNA ligase [Mesorhizobium sp.]
MSDAQRRLRLYNTLTRTKEDFSPIDANNVRMYVCGPTVYDFAHIGNARPVIVFDVLFRLLRHLYGEDQVTYVRNITDVDDKINARAARDFPGLPLNEAIRKVTEATNAQFQADVKALGCLEPTFQPRATEHIDGMRAMIDRLVGLEVAYVAEGHVLFSPKRMTARVTSPRYGALAKRSLDEMLAGARVDVASYKEDEMDFVLWKPSKDGEPGWPSPAGIDGLGRPGWHIECSAMSMAKLLEPFGGGLQCDDPEKNVFDIHGGGIDLVFPHHENEIAQSCCAFGTERMANIWMHNGFLQVEGRKMSKSEGNFVTINELLNTETFGGFAWPGEVIRYAMLKTHYRQPIDFTVGILEEASVELSKFWHAAAWVDEFASPSPEFVDALSDDLNLPRATAELHRLASNQVLVPALQPGDGVPDGTDALDNATMAAATVIANLALIGIQLKDFDPNWPQKRLSADVALLIEQKVAGRLALIREKNWAEADRIRDELLAQGIQLKDGKDPATGERVTTWEVKR